jgi:hypothetical protein
MYTEKLKVDISFAGFSLTKTKSSNSFSAATSSYRTPLPIKQNTTSQVKNKSSESHNMLKIFFLLSVVSLAILDHAVLSDAFPVFQKHFRATSVTVTRSRSPVTALYIHSEDEHGDFFDVESARRQLESLVTGGGDARDLPQKPDQEHQQSALRPEFASIVSPKSSETLSALPATPTLEITLPARPPLTTIERERRLAEIKLLAQLNEGDESLSDIWNLWFAERGSQAADLLYEADELINQGHDGWEEAELILRALIEDFGVYFSEPLNRLATLYYLQGRYEEALRFNKLVLAVKPWHFGALSHIVMVYAALGDNERAREWAAFRLPTVSPAGSNRRWTRWVERAVVDSTVLLHQGEEKLAKLFGEPDKNWIETQVENDADAWQ